MIMVDFEVVELGNDFLIIPIYFCEEIEKEIVGEPITYLNREILQDD